MSNLDFYIPKSREDIESLKTTGTSESPQLEYKSIRSLDNTDKNKKEISKDVSSMANSAGGVIIYGIEEDRDTHAPREIRGLPASENKTEWLENIVNSTIAPLLSCITIESIEVSADEFVIVVAIPQSPRAPHQAHDKKYYKRYNLKSSPMEDYEISDVRARSQQIDPLLQIYLEPDQGMFYFAIANVGDRVAENISINIQDELREFWASQEQSIPVPSILANGLRSLAPGKTLKYMLSDISSFMSSLSGHEISIRVTYAHPKAISPVNDTFWFRPDDMKGLVVEKNPVIEVGQRIERSIKELCKHSKSASEQSALIYRALNQIALLEQARAVHNCQEKDLARYQLLCSLVVSSTHKNFVHNLSSFLSYLSENEAIAAIISCLPSEPDSEAWFRNSCQTGGSMVGSADLTWPVDRFERLVLQKSLLRSISEEKVSPIDISIKLMYVSGRFDDCISEVVRIVFIPFSAELGLFLREHIEPGDGS
ncbi:MAG: helix-turn-helix domain-containing protein [Cyanobacteriota bacterium]